MNTISPLLIPLPQLKGFLGHNTQTHPLILALEHQIILAAAPFLLRNPGTLSIG